MVIPVVISDFPDEIEKLIIVQTRDGLVSGKIATTIIENLPFYEIKGICHMDRMTT